MSSRSRSFALPVALVMLTLAGSAVFGAEVDLDRRISLSLKQAELRQVLELYRDILEVQVEIDPAVEGTITIAFDDITVRTSLNAICESAKCRWGTSDGDPATLRFERDDSREASADDAAAAADSEAGYRIDSPVTLQLSDADATTVLKVAAKLIGARMLMDIQLEGETITVNAEAVPLSTVLDTVCRDLGCAWKLTGAEPPTLQVYYP